MLDHTNEDSDFKHNLFFHVVEPHINGESHLSDMVVNFLLKLRMNVPLKVTKGPEMKSNKIQQKIFSQIQRK